MQKITTPTDKEDDKQATTCIQTTPVIYSYDLILDPIKMKWGKAFTVLEFTELLKCLSNLNCKRNSSDTF